MPRSYLYVQPALHLAFVAMTAPGASYQLILAGRSYAVGIIKAAKGGICSFDTSKRWNE